jgi:hypothetical protein
MSKRTASGSAVAAAATAAGNALRGALLPPLLDYLCVVSHLGTGWRFPLSPPLWLSAGGQTSAAVPQLVTRISDQLMPVHASLGTYSDMLTGSISDMGGAILAMHLWRDTVVTAAWWPLAQRVMAETEHALGVRVTRLLAWPAPPELVAALPSAFPETTAGTACIFLAVLYECASGEGLPAHLPAVAQIWTACVSPHLTFPGGEPLVWTRHAAVVLYNPRELREHDRAAVGTDAPARALAQLQAMLDAQDADGRDDADQVRVPFQASAFRYLLTALVDARLLRETASKWTFCL